MLAAEPTPTPSEPLLILGIETSNPSAAADGLHASSVAMAMVNPVTMAVELLAEEWLAPTSAPSVGAGGRAVGMNPDDTLMPAIARLFERSGRSVRDLRRIAVSVGPGGYTGVRVACATATMLAEAVRAQQRHIAPAQRCGCIPVPSHLSAAMAFSLCSDTSHAAESAMAVVLAAKGDSAWVSALIQMNLLSIRDMSPLAAMPGSVMNAAGLGELADRGVFTLLADRFLPSAMAAEAERRGLNVQPIAFNAAALLHAAIRLPTIEPGLLVPRYPREPDAVTLWRQRRASF